MIVFPHLFSDGLALWPGMATLLYLIRDLGRLFISENFPLLVGLITLWSLIFSKDFILLVVYYIVVADQDVIVDNKSAIKPWSKSPKIVTKSDRGGKSAKQ